MIHMQFQQLHLLLFHERLTLAENRKYFCVGAHADSASLFEDPAQEEQVNMYLLRPWTCLEQN